MVTGKEKLVISGGGITLPLMRTVLEISGVERPQMLVEASALANQEMFDGAEKLRNFLDQCVGNCQWLQSDYATEPSPEQAQDAVQAADILFVMGGNTRRTVAKWREWGITDLAKERIRAGEMVATGGSAGALIWFQRSYSDSRSCEVKEGERWNYIGVKTTGLLPSWTTVHYKDVDDFNRRRDVGFKRFLQYHEGEWTTAVGFESAAAMVCRDGLVRAMDVRTPEKRDGPEQTIHIFEAGKLPYAMDSGETIPLESLR